MTWPIDSYTTFYMIVRPLVDNYTYHIMIKKIWNKLCVANSKDYYIHKNTCTQTFLLRYIHFFQQYQSNWQDIYFFIIEIDLRHKQWICPTCYVLWWRAMFKWFVFLFDHSLYFPPMVILPKNVRVVSVI
jgi:hypothetical protein